jgi:hypothetical protein
MNKLSRLACQTGTPSAYAIGGFAAVGLHPKRVWEFADKNQSGRRADFV